MPNIYLITGTSRGLGLEMVRQLLSSGNTVYALARSPERSPELQKLKQQFGGKLLIFGVDVSSDERVAAVAAELRDKPIDVLINNAGQMGSSEDFEKLSLEEVQKTFAVNSVGPMRVTRAFLPNLKASRNPKVVHITSLMGSIGDNESGGYYAYRMSKAALNMFNKSFALDHPELTAIVLHPGWVKTDMGGPQAPLLPEQAVQGILAMIDQATQQSSGKFLDYEGDELPW